MRIRVPAPVVSLCLFAAVLLAGCGSLAPGPTRVDFVFDAGPGEVGVVALDNVFRDQVLRISTDDTVVFVNRGQNDHNIVPTNSKGWGVPKGDEAEFARGLTYKVKFDLPGTYEYYCTIHATPTRGMIGSIIVEER